MKTDEKISFHSVPCFILTRTVFVFTEKTERDENVRVYCGNVNESTSVFFRSFFWNPVLFTRTDRQHIKQ
jgi:hypothetical protein